MVLSGKKHYFFHFDFRTMVLKYNKHTKVLKVNFGKKFKKTKYTVILVLMAALALALGFLNSIF